MKRISASGMKVTEVCPGSAALADVWMESGDAAEAGTGRHGFLASLQTMTHEEALALVPEDAPWRKTCVSIDPECVPRGRAEVGVAYDPETGEAHWLAAGRNNTGYDPSIPAHWITGTIDLFVEAEQWVIDWKGPEKVDDPGVNFQLGIYAMILAKLMGWDFARVSIANVDPSGSIHWHDDLLDVWALAAIEQRTIAAYQIAQLATREEGPYNRGVHCTRCSSLGVCPAAMNLVAALVAAPPFDATGMLPDDLARAWEDAAIVREALAQVQRAVEDAVYPLGSLQLPSGGSLQVIERPRKKIDAGRAYDHLVNLFGEAKVRAAMDMTITNEAAEKLAKVIAPPRKGTAYALEFWSSMRALGHVKETRYQTVLLVRASKKGAAASGTKDEE